MSHSVNNFYSFFNATGHVDELFLKSRPLKDNLSLEYWCSIISKRMDFDVSTFRDSPFVSYSLNHYWLKLAFDIAKLQSSNIDEYRAKWLSILYPKLSFQNGKYLDPITFAPYFVTGRVKVYLVDSLPKFTSAKETMEGDFKRILNGYYLYFGESYFYVWKTKKFYYVFADGEVEDLSIIDKEKFHLLLLELLQKNNSEIRFGTKSLMERVVKVSNGRLEQLIMSCGGYPNLDLRSYYISDDKDRIFSNKSFFTSRCDLLNNDSGKISFVFNDHKYKTNKNSNDFQDILPHIIFDDYSSKLPRPLSIAELGRLRHKEDFKPYTDGKVISTIIRRIITKVFANKWLTMQVPISRHLLIDLINVLHKCYFMRSTKDFLNFKCALNNWSKSALQNNFHQVVDFYQGDLQDLLALGHYSKLMEKYKNWQGKLFWSADGIREIYKFYSNILKINLEGSFKRYHVLDLFMNIILEEDSANVFPDVQAILVHCLEQCPDQVKLFVNAFNYDEIRGDIVSHLKLIDGFKKILKYSTNDNQKDISDIILWLETIGKHTKLKAEQINTIIKIYKKYNHDVKNTEHDHTKKLTDKSRDWHSLAKILTGMGYFDDYLKLLCPDLLFYTDNITGKPFSIFDLRHCIFSSNRHYLIYLGHSRNLYKMTGFAFDCSGPKLRYLVYDEVVQIKTADSQFHNYYDELAKQNLNVPQFNFRFISALTRLVTVTNSIGSKKDKTKYIIELVENNSERGDKKEDFWSNNYRRLMNTVIISITDMKKGLICKTDFNGLQKDASCYIDDCELSKKLSRPLTNLNIKQHELEIIYTLRKKSFLPEEYSLDQESKIDREYKIFNNFYQNLTVAERNCLNSFIIHTNSKMIYFREIYLLARYDIIYANRYFVYMLRVICPTINFPINSYWRIKPSDIEVHKVTFKNPEEDIDKLFVSFLTHYFVPENSLPNRYIDIMAHDMKISFPPHKVLVDLISSFENHYIGTDRNQNVIALECEYLNEIFFKYFYSQIDEYPTQNFEHKFIAGTYNWVNKVISGEVFKFMQLFEPDEIKNIISVIQDSSSFFSETSIYYFNEFLSVIRNIERSPPIFIRLAMNVNLIKFLFSLTRYKLALKSDLPDVNTIYVQPYTIYLSKDYTYVLLDEEGHITNGELSRTAVDLGDLDVDSYRLENKKKILQLIAKTGHISLAETDFFILFKIVYTHPELSVYTKKLVNLFLISQGIEETSDIEIKKHLINIFKPNLNSDNLRLFYKDVSSFSFEYIFKQLLSKSDSEKFNHYKLVRSLSPYDIGLEIEM